MSNNDGFNNGDVGEKWRVLQVARDTAEFLCNAEEIMERVLNDFLYKPLAPRSDYLIGISRESGQAPHSSR